MTQANASSLSPSLNALPRAAAILAALVGAAVLAGWSLDIAVLKSVVPGLATAAVARKDKNATELIYKIRSILRAPS